MFVNPTFSIPLISLQPDLYFMCLCTIGRSTKGGRGGVLPRRATKRVRAGRNNELKTLVSELLHYFCLFPLRPVRALFPSSSSPCFVPLFVRSVLCRFPLPPVLTVVIYLFLRSLPLTFPSSSSPRFVISLVLQSVL